MPEKIPLDSLKVRDYEEFFIYFENNAVIRIEADTQKHKTEHGINSNSAIKEVQDIYPNLENFVLRNSGASNLGGKDFIYLVDNYNEIAFKFRFSKSKKKRTVSKLIVFQPNSFFQPK